MSATSGTFSTAQLAGTKRKQSAAKFYAVHTGRRPGIYRTWDDCSAQVKNFSNPVYKSFSTESDAQAFLNAKTPAMAAAVGPTSKWYGVRVGRNPGVYSAWLAVQDEISGVKDAKYKGFKTRAEAEAFVAQGQSGTPAAPHPDQALKKKAKTGKGKGNKDDASESAMIDLANYAPGEAPMPEETEDGFDRSIILDEETGEIRYRTLQERSQLKPQPVRPTQNSAINIWTDGSTLGNGQTGAIAGVGVYFGPNDKRNLSQPLSGTRQTNQRAELTAILRAVEIAPKDKKLVLHSDSNYAINCVTAWFPKWRANSWHNASGKLVENKDLIVKIIDALEERQKLNKNRTHDATQSIQGGGPWESGPAGVKFVWVKGHANDAGNNAADALATSAARDAKEMHHFASEEVII